jgi:hypothetical protein
MLSNAKSQIAKMLDLISLWHKILINQKSCQKKIKTTNSINKTLNNNNQTLKANRTKIVSNYLF